MRWGLRRRWLTSSEFAEISGIARSTVSSILTGNRNPGPKLWSKIQAALQLSPKTPTDCGWRSREIRNALPRFEKSRHRFSSSTWIIHPSRNWSPVILAKGSFNQMASEARRRAKSDGSACPNARRGRFLEEESLRQESGALSHRAAVTTTILSFRVPAERASPWQSAEFRLSP